MPLGDISEWFRWIEREEPTTKAWSLVRTFIAEIGDEPWRAPSMPRPDLSDQPIFEVRSASLAIPGERVVFVLYRHDYESGVVDLISVTQR